MSDFHTKCVEMTYLLVSMLRQPLIVVVVPCDVLFADELPEGHEERVVGLRLPGRLCEGSTSTGPTTSRRFDSVGES